MLLALLSKPRLVLESGKDESLKRQNAISSIIVVPSSELAEQYMGWAKTLWPESMESSLPSVVTCMHRDQDTSVEDHLKQLRDTNPHILVVSATRFQELLDRPAGPATLGISTLRTLVLDEADALLDLPPRFPSKKALWKHQRHPPPGLTSLNQIMAVRATYSGGLPIPRAGMEGERVKESIRRVQHQGADELYRRSQEKNGKGLRLSQSKARSRGETPLQLIALSATANAVLRNFLGARTGWLRTNVRSESEQRRRNGGAGKWIDLTGLSKGEVPREQGIDYPKLEGWPLQIPRQIVHSCVVVDEPSILPPGGAGGGERSELSHWRNLNPGEVRKGKDVDPEKESDPAQTSFAEMVEGKEEEEDAEQRETEKTNKRTEGTTTIVPPVPSSTGQVDVSLLEMLAYLFAIRNVNRGLALISPRWSTRAVVEHLQSLGVPATSSIRRSAASAKAKEENELVVLSASLVRGLDIPKLDHVFLVGPGSSMDIDTVSYVHDAGRVARIGQEKQDVDEEAATRASGNIVSIVKGVDPTKPKRKGHLERSTAELKMSVILKRLDVKCVPLDLGLPDEITEEEVAVTQQEVDGNNLVPESEKAEGSIDLADETKADASKEEIEAARS